MALSPLARGKGSWEGDLECAQPASMPKPVLKQALDEDTDFLDKSVIHPIRVKSGLQNLRSILQEASNAKTHSSDTLPPSFAEYLHSRIPSTELSRPKTSKSQHRYASNPTHFQHKTVKHKRIKSAPMKFTSDFEGQLALPKTYVTRKGALMLFTSPPNLAFSQQNDERCYFYDPNHVDTAQLALQNMRTLDHLTASVLKYGKQQQIFSKLASSKRNNGSDAKIGLLRYEGDDGVDLRAQPGGDFFFYLKDVQAKASYRSLTRSPSYHSLTSEEATEDLNSVLKTYDENLTDSYSMLGESTVRDMSVTEESTRDWLKSAASSIKASQMTETPTNLNMKLASESRNTRPNTGRTLQSSSAARTTTPLSFKEIAASLKCAPYLGRPLSAAYPPSYHSYVPTPPPFEHFTHPSEDEGDSDDHPQEEDMIRSSSRHSVKSQKSVRSQGTKSVQSDKSARSQKSFKSVSSKKHRSPSGEEGESPEDLPRTSALSRASNRSGQVSRRTASGQGVDDQEGEGDSMQRSVVSGRSPMSAGSRRSRVSWAGDQALEEDENFEEDDWRSEVIEMAGSEKADQIADLEDVNVDEAEAVVGADAVEEKDVVMEENLVLDESGDEVLQEERGSGDRKSTSRVSSATPRRIYTPRTRSSGRTTPIEVEEQELIGERIPSAVSRKSASRASHPVSDGEADMEDEDQIVTWPTEAADEEVSKTPVQGEATDGLEEENTDLEPSKEDTAQSSEKVEEEVEEKEEKADSEVIVPVEDALPLKPQEPEEKPQPETEVIQKTKPKTMLLEESVVLDARESKMKQPVPPKTKKSDFGSSLKGKPSLPAGGVKKSALTPITMQEKKTTPKEEPQASVKVTATPPPKPAKPAVSSIPKVKNEGKKSPRSGRKRGGGVKKSTFTGPELQFVGSMAIDPYAGKPSKEEVDDLVAEELAKELAAQNLVEEVEEKKQTEEVKDEVDSLATDDEAIEMELKKTRVPSKKKESKKKLAKDRAALKEARRLEKQRREEEMKALQEKKRQMEEERKRLDLEEIQRKQELAEIIEEAEREAEMAREAEEEAKRMMQDARRIAREEREAKRREDAEKRRMEREMQREERKKMEESAKQREKEMAENLATAEERRKMQEQARSEREERERLEQEERERLEEEELLRQEEEEEKIRELERQAEKEAMERLVREREAAEKMRQEAELERKKQEAREEQKRQAELAEKTKEEERLLLLKIEEEQKRQKELDKIRQIQKLEEEARGRVRKELERRRARAMRRREFNLEQQEHMNGLRRTQGMTKPWVFTYYVHWPRDTYERRLPSGDKKKKRAGGRPRAKTAPPMVAEAKPQTTDTAAGP